MACCSSGGKANKSSSSCLGRCDLPRHRCLYKSDVKPGPVPRHMGWHYTAKDAPEHQLRCGWRPGHISCPVLRRIEQHNCMKAGECGPCPSACSRSVCSKPCCAPPKCVALCPSTPSCCKAPMFGQPLIRIIRHGGQYTICTKPSNMSNAPSGPYPLKYVLNTDDNDPPPKTTKYSVEAKFNDYHFDYTSSQSSFILDFSPPEQRCYKPCPKKGMICMRCEVDTKWPAICK
ncbi:uncharacterized protein LOC128674017 [Plodia interpunctella]|uniref:uncharacterized protein LOC128674017 n=1 Tax=Plodia interpunctella TaxID=58824 RepID=UPI002368A9A5|nr:uncharacterized protein LOC128674017 [Plodia interpunctella]